MNIYISGLNFSTTDADLNDLFSEYGEVSSARIITDRETRRSRGFGFVEMPDDAAGQKAIDELNGAEFDHKQISVNVAGMGKRDKRAAAPDRHKTGNFIN